MGVSLLPCDRITADFAFDGSNPVDPLCYPIINGHFPEVNHHNLKTQMANTV
jgi:hypothetical protein